MRGTAPGDSHVARNRLWSRLNGAVAALDDAAADAADGRRPRRVRRQRRRPRPARRRQADPGRLEVAAGAGAARAGAGRTRASTACSATRCARHSGWSASSVSDDIVIAYPTVDRAALARAGRPRRPPRAAITLMVDDVAQLDVVDSVRSSHAVRVRVALDIDAGLRMGGQHVGPKRSPLHDVEDVAAPRPRRHRAARLRAGRGDDLRGPGRRRTRRRARRSARKSLVVRRLKSASMAQLRERRRVIADRLAELVDAGVLERRRLGLGRGHRRRPRRSPRSRPAPGCWCRASSTTTSRFAPRPAAFYGLPVDPAPLPDDGHRRTAAASIASGPDRRRPLARCPWAPPGLHLTGLEGAGEVQTPLTGTRRRCCGSATWCGSATRSPVSSSSTPTPCGCSPATPSSTRCRRTAGCGNAW